MAIRKIREIGDEVLTKTMQRSDKDDTSDKNTDR